jgi:hypothetical protein
MTTFSAPPHHTRGRDHGGNKNKMLASTMQFPNNNPHRALHTLPHGKDASTRPEPGPGTLPHGRTPTRNNHPPPRSRITPPTWPGTAGPVVPGPNSVPTPPRPSGPGDAPLPLAGATPRPTAAAPIPDAVLREPTGRYDHGARFVDVPPLSNPPVHTRDRHGQPMDHPGTRTRSPGGDGHVLLRKEVIQPHLPVRLPCYDLVPIASPTFDGSPHKGWATGFGCYRLS